jgi:hypothetical protein
MNGLPDFDRNSDVDDQAKKVDDDERNISSGLEWIS